MCLFVCVCVKGGGSVELSSFSKSTTQSWKDSLWWRWRPLVIISAQYENARLKASEMQLQGSLEHIFKQCKMTREGKLLHRTMAAIINISTIAFTHRCVVILIERNYFLSSWPLYPWSLSELHMGKGRVTPGWVPTSSSMWAIGSLVQCLTHCTTLKVFWYLFLLPEHLPCFVQLRTSRLSSQQSELAEWKLVDIIPPACPGVDASSGLEMWLYYFSSRTEKVDVFNPQISGTDWD